MDHFNMQKRIFNELIKKMHEVQPQMDFLDLLKIATDLVTSDGELIQKLNKMADFRNLKI